MVGAVLDSGAGFSWTVCAMQKWFPEVDVICPYKGEEHQVVRADGRAVSIKRQTYPLTANIMKP